MIKTRFHDLLIGCTAKCLVILLILATGCYTPQKAHKQGSRWVVTYPADAAAVTRDAFPCVPRGTDTTYISDSSAYQEVLLAIQTELFQAQQTNDSLDAVIANQRPVIDSQCQSYQTAIIELKRQNIQLVYRLQHIPAIRDTVRLPPVIDKADITACAGARDKAIETANTEMKDRKSWQGKALVRWWISFGLIFLIIGWLGAKIYFKTKKP